MEYYSKPYKSD